MLGQFQRADEFLLTADKSGERESRAWARQAGGVTRADILHLLGREKQAVASAVGILEETGLLPISHAYAGPVARWIAKCSEQLGRKAEAVEILGILSEELDNHDVVDQAEIVLARSWIERRNGTPWQDGRTLLERILPQLPSVTQIQLSRLGFDI